MKIKGTLLSASIAVVIALSLFVITLFSISHIKFFTAKPDFLAMTASDYEIDWTLKLIKGLGDFDVLKPDSENLFKKETYIVRSEYPLTEYLKHFEKYMRRQNIRYHHYFRQKRSFHTLFILFEEHNDFLRLVEIKKKEKKNKAIQISQNSYAKPGYVKPSYICIVIDDVGQSNELDKEYLRYPFPLTFAVFPFKPYSKAFAKKAKKYKKEVIIHAPMRGADDINFAYDINQNISDEDMQGLIKRYREEIPNAIGLNNDRGSIATADRLLMGRFFRYFKNSSMYFLDSRTSAKTVAAELARQNNVPTLERDIFLDNQDNLNYISRQIKKLVKLARFKRGAIGIGHYHKRNTLIALKTLIPYFKKNNVRLLPLSSLIKSKKKDHYVSLRN